MGADSGVLIRALSDGPATALTGGSLLARRWNLAERANNKRQYPAKPHRRTAFRSAGQNGEDSPGSLPGSTTQASQSWAAWRAAHQRLQGDLWGVIWLNARIADEPAAGEGTSRLLGTAAATVNHSRIFERGSSMAIGPPSSKRVLNSSLERKIMSADEAAGLIRSGEQIGMSGFTGSGYPKAVPIELARRIAEANFRGQKFQVSVFTGA